MNAHVGPAQTLKFRAQSLLAYVLAPRHSRVMGAENVDRGLVGPHLPPVVSGGRPIDPPTLGEDAPTVREEGPPAVAQTAPEKTESLIVEGNVRSGQTIMHAQGDV